MPLEVSIKSDSTEAEHSLGLLLPHFGICFDDYSEPCREAIAVRCADDDSAGEVYVWASSDEEVEDFHESNLPLDAQKFIVTADEPYERPMTDHNGDTGTIKVQYFAAKIVLAVELSLN